MKQLGFVVGLMAFVAIGPLSFLHQATALAQGAARDFRPIIL